MPVCGVLSLYVAMPPHTAILPKAFICCKATVENGPPTWNEEKKIFKMQHSTISISLPHCLHFQRSSHIRLEKPSSGLPRANWQSYSWRPHRSRVLWDKPPWRPSLQIPPPCTPWSWQSDPPPCPPPLLRHSPAGSHPSGDPKLLLSHTEQSV